MHKPQQDVRQLHLEVIGSPTSPAEPQIRHGELRSKLILEEAMETVVALVGAKRAAELVLEAVQEIGKKIAEDKAAYQEPNLVEAIDGIVDTIVVCYGTAEDIGVDLEPFWDEVHRSNMAKRGGPVRADGKKLKPPGWMAPDIKGVLERVRTVNHAAVALIERSDGKILCVWNRRYNGWSLPGGKVEDGETVDEAVQRELLEEVGLLTRSMVKVFEGDHGLKVESTRGSRVHVFRVTPCPGTPRQMEDGCPVRWLTINEFIKESPFGEFYKRVFARQECE